MFVFILLNKLLNLIQSNNDQKSNGFWYKFKKKIRIGNVLGRRVEETFVLLLLTSST